MNIYCLFFLFYLFEKKHVHYIDPWLVRTFSGLCGLGVLAGATMVPVTSVTSVTSVSSLRGKMASEASHSGHRGQAASAIRKPNRLLRLILGQELASSNRLGHYFLFVFTDFLCFTSVYIPYTHLPNFAEVTHTALLGFISQVFNI